MKVGIITFHFVSNQGGVLQAYALQTYLEKNGYDTSIINYRPGYHTIRYKANKNPFAYSKWYWKKFADRHTLKRIQLTLRSFVRCLYMNYKHTDREVERLFADFTNKNLHETEIYTSLKGLKKNPPKLDAYVSGSDQLWGPDLLNLEFDPAYFLNFGEALPKITYAVSTGRDLTSEELSKLRGLSEDLTAVSLREYNESTIKAVGKDVHICIDPTLLLDASDYANVENKLLESDSYIFVYGFETNEDIKQAIGIASKKYECKIINGSPNRIKLDGDIVELRDYGPDRFLSLIKNAQCVVTNSFHGTAFSIIYKKEFITVAHSTRGRRMVELLNKVELNYRLWGDSQFSIEKCIDWEAAYEKLSILRKGSSEYLLSAIEGKERGRNSTLVPGTRRNI